MLFNSLHFAFFFPIVAILYFALPFRRRWILLLVASYYFYMSWNAVYALLIIASTVVDYIAGIKMGAEPSQHRRKVYLLMSLVANLGLLFFFKYFNFVNSSLRGALGHFDIPYSLPDLDFLLPVGISFYTFQTLSYTIDVFRGRRPPERHLGIFALYVSFFPQLVAGPIERSTRLLPQFLRKHRFEYERVRDGLQLVLWGLFKKMVIADRLAVYVDQVYNNVTDYTGLPLIVATYFFAIQIYCDFSGYSDIAIGVARVMGFDLMENFRRPYYSKSIAEFWKRWHISLSTWFRDYLYVAIGGNRVVKQRWYLNIVIVFVVSGFWHGANWTFLVWGALHGLYLIFALWTGGMRRTLVRIVRLDRHPTLHKWVQVGVTFHLVLFAWIFFRAQSLGDAAYVVTHMFKDLALRVPTLADSAFGTFDLAGSLLMIALMEIMHIMTRRRSLSTLLGGMNVSVRWGAYVFIMFTIIIFSYTEQYQFIYFQF